MVIVSLLYAISAYEKFHGDSLLLGSVRNIVNHSSSCLTSLRFSSERVEMWDSRVFGSEISSNIHVIAPVGTGTAGGAVPSCTCEGIPQERMVACSPLLQRACIQGVNSENSQVAWSLCRQVLIHFKFRNLILAFVLALYSHVKYFCLRKNAVVGAERPSSKLPPNYWFKAV